MKQSRIVLLAAFIVMAALALFISVMSIKDTSGRSGGMVSFSFGGKAALRNEIEIPLSELDSLVMEYGSKNINVYLSEDENVIIKEYLYSNNPKAIASVSYTGDKEAVVTGGEVHSLVIFGFWMEGERIEVYVPEKGLEKLSLETGSGNITSDVSCVRKEGSLLLKAGSGNIRLSNAEAETLLIQTNSGNVKLENMNGNLKVETGSGNITGNQIEGKMDAQAGSGNITLTEISCEGNIEAGSGNVKVETIEVTGDMSLTTRSGNIHLELPENLAFHFQAETGSGNISTDFDKVLSYNKKGNQAEGEVGEGASLLNIRVKAGSGNVRVSY